VRVVLLFLGNQEGDVGSIRTTAIMHAFGVHRGYRPSVVPNEATHVPESLPARERPKCLLAEEKIYTAICGSRIRQRWHYRAQNGSKLEPRATQCIEDVHHRCRLTRGQRGLGFDEARIQAARDCNWRRLIVERSGA